ncbi:MAG TPA: hypothetical protein VNR18_12430 [Hyphomicrobiales bacterium]|nr:hypothetical protein [Hyphomicrobiales bacterium]
MKSPMLHAPLMFCLALLACSANADTRFGPSHGFGFADGGAIEWRLGDFRNHLQGHEILYRTPGSKRWQVAPGAATALSNGWVLGTDRHRGGYGIYRWNGRGWSRMPGTAVRIGGSYRQPWVVNDSGIRYTWNGYEWRQDSASQYRNDRGHRDVQPHTLRDTRKNVRQPPRPGRR